MMIEKKSTWQLCLHVLKGRWTVVVFAFYVMSCAGATYIFGLYSGAIKTALNYDQETIDTLSFFKDLGANVGIISGLLNEVMPAWFILAVGACMNMFGYLMIWLAVTHRIARPHVWHIYLYMCIGANSQTFANTGALVTCVKNFPQSRGVVLGLLKGFVGISGAIFTQLYHALYGQDSRGVILLIGWLPALVSLMFMFFIRPMRPEMDKSEGKHFYSFLYLSLLLAGFLMIVIIVENQVPFSSFAYKAMGAITVLLVVANLCIGVKAELEKLRQQQAESNWNPQQLSSSFPSSEGEKKHALVASKEKPPSSEESTMAATEPPLTALSAHSESLISSAPRNGDVHHSAKVSEVAKMTADSEDKKTSQSHTQADPIPRSSSRHENADSNHHVQRFSKLCRRFTAFYWTNWPERGDDFTIPQALVSFDMWILFVAITCGVGGTLTAIDNMGQIGASQGYSQTSISTFVSLISIWNFLGRVVAGFSSEILLKRYRFPRTLLLTIILAFAGVGHLLIAFPTPGSLYIASIIVGLCFGAQWPILFAVISELFGLKYYATLYNLGGVASPVGSYLLNVRVAGNLYDKEARKQQAQLLSSSAASHAPPPTKMASSDLSCVGAECFRETFLIMTAVSVLGAFISVILVLRTKKFYSQDIYARFRDQDDQAKLERAVSTESSQL